LCYLKTVYIVVTTLVIRIAISRLLKLIIKLLQPHIKETIDLLSKNFKVVCECGVVFKTKRIKILKTVYDKTKKIKNPMDERKSCDTVDESPVVSRAINMMTNLGYTSKESSQYVSEAYLQSKTEDASFLVKKAISKIGGIEAND
jgi:Holliday junction resolvasome RuvABC DNA-binding subunit